MLREVEKIVEKARKDEDVLAVILFGSCARKERYSDVDVCVVLDSKEFSPLFLSKKRLEYLKDFPNMDVRVFQQLPSYVKVRVFKDGELVLCKDEDRLYDLNFFTIREFECFEPIYLGYLEGVLNA